MSLEETANQRGAAVPVGSLLRFQLGLTYLAFILIGANDGATGVLIPSLRAFYHVDKATISFLFLASTAGYLLSAFTTGLIQERLGRRLFFVAGTAAFLVGVAILGLMPPFALALLALFLIGLGVAVIDAGLNAYIAELPNNTALLNYLHAFYGAGALIGPLVASGILALSLGWNMVYIIWAGVSLLLLVLFPLIFRGHGVPGHANTRPGTNDEADITSNVLSATLKLRGVWLAATFLLFYVGAEVSLGSWAYSFLTEERRGDELLSGWVVSGYWLGLTVGRLVLGRVGSRIGNARLITFCLVGVAAGVLLVWLVPIEGVSAFGLWLAGFSLGPIFPTTIALLSDLVPGRLMPSAVGFVASFGAVGAAFFPWIAGNLAERLGLWTLLPYVVVLTAVMLVLWPFLHRRSSRDMRLPDETPA